MRKKLFVVLTVISVIGIVVGISYASAYHFSWQSIPGNAILSISTFFLFLLFLENRRRQVKTIRAVMVTLIIVFTILGFQVKTIKTAKLISKDEMAMLIKNGDAIAKEGGLVVLKNSAAYKLLHTKTQSSYSKWGDKEHKVFEYRLVSSRNSLFKGLAIMTAVILGLMSFFIEVLRKES